MINHLNMRLVQDQRDNNTREEHYGVLPIRGQLGRTTQVSEHELENIDEINGILESISSDSDSRDHPEAVYNFHRTSLCWEFVRDSTFSRRVGLIDREPNLELSDLGSGSFVRELDGTAIAVNLLASESDITSMAVSFESCPQQIRTDTLSPNPLQLSLTQVRMTPGLKLGLSMVNLHMTFLALDNIMRYATVKFTQPKLEFEHSNMFCSIATGKYYHPPRRIPYTYCKTIPDHIPRCEPLDNETRHKYAEWVGFVRNILGRDNNDQRDDELDRQW